MRSCWSNSLGNSFCASENGVLLPVVLRVLQRVSGPNLQVCTTCSSSNGNVPLHERNDIALFNHHPSPMLCVRGEINTYLLKEVVRIFD